ncbi:hypothetical protein ACFLRA_03985 [Bdellovibrionota bacterium]
MGNGAYFILWKPFDSLSEVGDVADKALTKYGVLRDIEEQNESIPVVSKNSEKSTFSEKVEDLEKHLSEETIDKLEKTTVNEAQRQLVRDFNHEVRSQFTVLNGLIEILGEKAEDKDEEEKELIFKVHKQLNSFWELINKFVEVMRSEVSVTKPVQIRKDQVGEIHSMQELMVEVSQVFKGVLFQNRLTVDVNLPHDLKVPSGKGPKLKLVLVTLISHVAKVMDDCHMIIFGGDDKANVHVNCEIYVVEEGGELGRIVDGGCHDAKETLREINGSMRVLEVTEHQVNVEFIIPKK